MNKRRNITKFLPAAVITLIFITAGCTANAKTEPLERNTFALDTFVTVTVYDKIDEEIVDNAIKLCCEYEDIFYPVNTENEEARKVIADGLKMTEETGGAFDITMAELIRLWDFKAEDPKVPDRKAIDKALKTHEYDLGAIAKGYIADRMKEYLVKNGVTSGIINLGGNVLCIGKRPDGSNFRIGIQAPFRDRTKTIDTVEVDDMAVVTSGVYERHFEIDGKNYHHILDPETGYPYETDIASVTIICGNSEEADALSTAALCLGVEKGSELIEAHGARGIIVMEDSSVIYVGE